MVNSHRWRALLLAGALCLAGCGQPAAPSESEMYLQPAKLTQEESNILKLVGGSEPSIFTFSADGRLEAVQVRAWLLQDGAWEQQSGDFCVLDGGEGRLSLELEDLSRHWELGIQQGEDTSYTSWTAPEEATFSGLSRTTSLLSEQVPLVYGEEIPLAVQIFSSQNMVHAYDVQTFFAPEEYAQWGHEAVYAVTACFLREGEEAS